MEAGFFVLPGFGEGGGLGAEGCDLDRGAALVVVGVGDGDAEVSAEVSDDVGEQAVVDVVLEVWAVQSLIRSKWIGLGSIRQNLTERTVRF